jgi:hypothetical protein
MIQIAIYDVWPTTNLLLIPKLIHLLSQYDLLTTDELVFRITPDAGILNSNKKKKKKKNSPFFFF